MNSRFYVTATVALLLAAAYNGAAKRSDEAASSTAAQADAQPTHPGAPLTARTLPAIPRAALPRS
jgi:hypothetical protein